MAPEDQNLNRPNQIDVSLSLINSESRQDVQALIATMRELKDALTVAKSPTAEAANAAARRGIVRSAGTGINANAGVSASVGAPTAEEQQRRLAEAARHVQAAAEGTAPLTEAGAAQQQALSDAASRVREAATGVPQTPKQPGQETPKQPGEGGGGASRPPDIRETEEEARKKLQYVAGGGVLGKLIGRTYAKKDPEKRLADQDEYNKMQAEQDYDPELTGEQYHPSAQADIERNRRGGAVSGRPSKGASASGELRPHLFEEYDEGVLPAWTTGARMAVTPLRIPRLGEYTAQDYLEQASSIMGRWGARRFNRVVADEMAQNENLSRDEAARAATEQGAGAFRGHVGAMLGTAAGVAPKVAAFQGLTNFATSGLGRMGVDASVESNRELGQLMGRGTAQIEVPNWIPGLGGMRFDAPRALQPFLPGATQRGIIERMEAQFTNRGYENLSGQRREEILETAVTSGYGYEDRPEMMEQYMDTASMALSDRELEALPMERYQTLYDQAMRPGTTEVDEFVDSIKAIPDAAKAARMNVSEFAASMAEMGETFQNELGGYANQGHRYAQQFATATGMDPRVGQELLQNPYVQGHISMQTGLMPTQIGALPGAALTGGITEAIKSVRGMVAPGTTPDVEHEIPGVGRIRVSGEQGDDAIVAQALGMSMDQLHQFEERAEQTTALSNLMTSAEVNQGQRAEANQRAARGDHGLIRELTSGEDAEDNLVSNRELTRLMREADFSQKEIAKVWEEKPFNRRSIIDEIASEKMGKLTESPDDPSETRVEVKLGFSREASQWIEEVERKVDTSFVPKRGANSAKKSIDPTDGDQVKTGRNRSSQRPRSIVGRSQQGG